MKTFGGLYSLTLATLLLSIGYGFAEEKCSEERKRLSDQIFGMPITPNDILTTIMGPWVLHNYFRPWRKLASLSKDLGSTIKTEKNGFQINLDVQHFAPEEITVKTADGYIIIEAKHEERQDEHGFVSRQFVRKYSLPDGVENENIVSELSSDGILSVKAPRKVIDDKGERVVPITKTGPIRQESKEDKHEGTCSADKPCNM